MLQLIEKMKAELVVAEESAKQYMSDPSQIARPHYNVLRKSGKLFMQMGKQLREAALAEHKKRLVK